MESDLLSNQEVHDLPEYDNPPVTEVVCGILFKPLEQFLIPYIGLLWNEFREDYPICREEPPLFPIIEKPGGTQPSEQQINAIMTQPRIWFIQNDQTGLIQIQRDRFLYNWRKTKNTDEYPRYANVSEKFRDYLKKFYHFLKEHNVQDIVPLQYEMTYVNQVCEGWATFEDIGKIFPDFTYRSEAPRFISSVEDFNWRTSFLLPYNNGRLHVIIQNVSTPGDNLKVLILELTVRGMAHDDSMESMSAWFDMAHEVIVRSFADLTSDEIQRIIWRRRN